MNFEKIKAVFKTEKGMKLLVFLAVAGMCLILLPSIIPKSRAEPENSSDLKSYAETYRDSLQTEISEMLSKTKDVGRCEVLLTIAATEENIYANRDNTEKIVMPKFSGAYIICDGGDSPQVKERIIFAVSSILGIPTNKISVGGYAPASNSVR